MLEYCSMKIADMSMHHEHALVNGVLVAQVNALARLVDSWNATHAANVVFENRRRVVEELSELGKLNNTGHTERRRCVVCSSSPRPELSSPTGIIAPLLTLQIRKWWSHLGEFKRDVANRWNLRRLVHQQTKLLIFPEMPETHKSGSV